MDITSNGSYCLEIVVPNCYYQVDFVKGCIIEKLGSGNLYGTRKISFANGGTTACVPTEPEGCTPGYWKNHTDRWVGYSTSESFQTVFGITNMQGLGNLTLLGALNLGGGGFASLARHATAGLLSASHSDVDYTYSADNIKALVKSAFDAGELGDLKSNLERANEAGCPLGGSSATTSLQGNSSKKSMQQLQGISLSAYPTPFADKATIAFTLQRTEQFTIDLYDMKGSLVKRLKAGTAVGGQLTEVEVDGASLGNGLYLARLVSQSESKVVKLLLKKQ
ncbi:T9SS type A sorting domain-containing protein [Pontibacter sp. CAU 1760]